MAPRALHMAHRKAGKRMARVNAATAARLAGVSERTMREWLKAGKIAGEKIQRPGHPAEWQIDTEQDLLAGQPPQEHELAARVLQLEQAFARLTRLVEALTGTRTPLPAPAPAVGLLSASGGHSDAPPGVPAGARRMKEITDLHQISHATAKRSIQQGIVAAFTRPQPGRPGYLEYWLLPSQIAPALRIWQDRGIAFTPCPDCPHE